MRKYQIRLILTILIFFLALPAVNARIVEAQGSALIKNEDVGAAREHAVRQASRQALMKTAALINSTSLISSNVLIADNLRVSTAGIVKDIVVLKEWMEADAFHVHIRAQVIENKLQSHVVARYRKKVGAIQFQVLDRRHITDMPDVEKEIPREILRRLENTGGVLAVDGAKYSSTETEWAGSGDMPDDNLSMSMFARKLGTQFLVAGTIRDMGVKKQLLMNSRMLVIDVEVYDGVSGALISKRRINESITGRGLYFNDVPFGSVEFLKTAYGKMIDRVLDQLIRGIESDIAQLPFTARVIRMEGDEIYFDAGATSLIKAGDILMTYQLANESFNSASNSYVGYAETPVASLLVKRVQPMFAVGELQDSKTTLKRGDMVRFGL